jgi:DNA-binding transcriptional LysR family regulator
MLDRNSVAKKEFLGNICCPMDLNRVRYFSILAEQKHVRKAAEILKINPASLSKAIRLLEHEVGFKLVIPFGRGIEITDRGINFYRQSQKLLQEYVSLKSSLENQGSHQTPLIRLGSMEVFTTYFLSKVIETETPSLKIRTRYLTPGQIEESLKLREIDVGLTYIRLPEEELNYLKIGEFHMGIYGAKAMVRSDLKDLQFVTPITGIDSPAISLKSLDGWPNDEFPRQIKYEFELLETALQVCRAGHAVVYCPDFVIELHNHKVKSEFRLYDVSPPAGFKRKKLSIYAVTRRNEEETQFVRKLAKIARSFS